MTVVHDDDDVVVVVLVSTIVLEYKEDWIVMSGG